NALGNIYTSCVLIADPMQGFAKIGLSCANQEMKMIAHETICMDLRFKFLTRNLKQIEKQASLTIISKNSTTRSATIHHVIESVGKKNSRSSGHSIGLS